MTGRTHGRIALFGRPVLSVSGRAIQFPEKGLFLIALAAAAKDHSIERETARYLLWPFAEPAKRAGNLRQLLNRINAVDYNGLKSPLILVGSHITLNLSEWSIDLVRLFEAESGKLDDYETFLWDEFLAGMNTPGHGVDDWISTQRLKINGQRALLLEDLLSRDGLEAPEVIKLSAWLIEIDPTSEVGWRALMAAQAGIGNRVAARKTFLQLRNVMAIDFGSDPSPETIGLARDLGLLDTQAQLGSSHDRQIDRSVLASEQPRVLILPPNAILDDPFLSKLGNALLEDVTIALSHQRAFRIIAAHTGIQMAKHALDPATPEVAHGLRHLDFDYTVYVTLQNEGEGFNATCRLTKVKSHEVLWAVNLPLDANTLRTSFNQLAKRIAASLADAIEHSEFTVSLDDTTPSAYRLYLEGKRYLNGTDLQALRHARKWFKQAVKRHEQFSPAHAGISRSLSMEWLVRGLNSDDEILELANSAAKQSLSMDARSGRAFRELGFVALYMRRFDDSLNYFQEAEEQNPSDADVLIDYCDALSHGGDLDQALALSERAFALNPLPPDYYFWILGSLHYVRGAFGKAIEVLQPIRQKSATARLLAASHAMADDKRQATFYASIVREEFPDFRSEHIRHFVPDRDPARSDMLVRGLQLAGLP